MNNTAKILNASHFQLLDWDFRDQNSRTFLHNLCWYPSRFIPMIPAQLISSLSSPGDTILDPFSGSGTVLVEALRHNRNAICIDLSVYGCFIAETKARIFSGDSLDLNELVSILEEVTIASKSVSEQMRFTSGNSLFEHQYPHAPNRAQNILWYNKHTLDALTSLYNRIETVNDDFTKNVLRLIFISILMGSSGHRGGRPYTYYADNVRPKELLAKNAYKLFSQKLGRFLREYEVNSPKKIQANWRVINGDSKTCLNEFVNSADLIVTSPPYLGVTDYITGFRLAHLWYQWGDPLETIKKDEIGARWRRKQPGIASDYLRDMEVSLEKMANSLRDGKHLCLVIGEAKRHLEKVNAHIIAFLQDKLGFALVHATSREISQKFFRHPKGGVEKEDILVFRK